MPKKPNNYLAKQQAMLQSAFEIGEDMGMQRYPHIKKIDYTKPIKGGNKG